MAIIVQSNTDTPEQVAAAMGKVADEPDTETTDKEGKDSTDKKESSDEQTPDNAADKGKTKDKGKAGAASKQASGKGDDYDSSDEDGEEDADTGEEGDQGDESSEDEAGDGEQDASGTKGDGKPDTQKPRTKKPGGFQKKIARLEEENKLLVDLLKKEGVVGGKKSDVKADAEPEAEPNYSGVPEPTLDQFKDEPDPPAAFSVAYAKWSHNENRAMLKAQATQQKVEVSNGENEKAFLSALNEDRAEGGIYEDYDQVLDSIAEEDILITELMQEQMMEARDENGRSLSHAMMHYLATHPDEARTISELSPKKQVAKMGMIQLKAETETANRRAAKEKVAVSKAAGGTGKDGKNSQSQAGATNGNNGPTNRKTTKAPPPINPGGKRSAPASKDLETVANSGDFKAYEAQRKQQGFTYR